MKILARTDPHATRDDTARAHPDWIAVDADGRPRRHWANPELWVTCALGPYNFEFMTAVHREIVSRYDIDGIFTNRWANQTDCYCEHCRRNFRAATGLELPRATDAGRSGAARRRRLAQGPAHRAVGRCGTPTSAAPGRARASCRTARPTCGPPG